LDIDKINDLIERYAIELNLINQKPNNIKQAKIVVNHIICINDIKVL